MKNLIYLIITVTTLNACKNEVLESPKNLNSAKVYTPKTQKDFEKQVRQGDFSSINPMMSELTEKDKQIVTNILTKNRISFHLVNDAKAPKNWQAAHKIAVKLIEEYKNETYYNHLSQYLTHYVVISKELLADPSDDAQKALKYYVNVMDETDSANPGLIYFSLKKLKNTGEDETIQMYKSNALKRLDTYMMNFEKQVLLIQAQSEKHRKEKNLPNIPGSSISILVNILEEQKFYYAKLKGE